MSSDAATTNDAARLLLDCFQELHAGAASYQDVEEAQRLASLPLTPESMTLKMRDVARRNGANWRPSSLRYFARPITDLLGGKPSLTVLPTSPAEEPCASLEDHENALEHLRSLETPEQRRRADRVTQESRGLPMPTRVNLATLMLGKSANLPPAAWDRQFEGLVTKAISRLPGS